MITELYEILNDSEKFGLQFGMFPADKLKGITREQCLDLLKLARERKYK